MKRHGYVPRLLVDFLGDNNHTSHYRFHGYGQK